MRILLVEDESRVAGFIAKGLREQAYAVDIARDGEHAIYCASVNDYDLVILDVMLPIKNGHAVCRDLRASGFRAPILMLTARDAVDDRVAGLDAGADDYLTKPFDFKELLARLRALSRRSATLRPPVARMADLTLDIASHTVTRAGKPLSLTAKEYALLEFLVLNEGRVVGREQIAQHVWDESFDPFSNIIDVYVKRLRDKLDTGYGMRLIHTRRGEGYIMTPGLEPAMSEARLPIIRSLRLQLTAWYLAFFSLLFVLFGLFLYGVLSEALGKRLDETLASQANTTAVLFQDELEEMHGDVPKAAAEAVSEMRLDGSTVAIFDGTRLLAASAPVPPKGFDAAVAEAASRSTPDFVMQFPYLGKSGARAAVHRMTAEGESARVYLMLAVEPLDSVAASLQVVRTVLFFGMPFLLALAGLGGFWLTTRSLAPLSLMAEQARKITGSNLESRLEIGNAAQELTMLSASFNELLSRLDQSFDGMRRFVADASHELRTPISVIRGEADVALSHDRAAEEYRESLAIILDESRRLSRLVDDLLNLARADAGHVRLQPQDFYFNDLLADCCRSVQSLASVRRIQLECRCAGDVPFRGDEELLRRLVVNLLDNAIRYTPPGGSVSAALEGLGGAVRISVADTGVGIAPEAAPHVFERFYRADKARSRADGGFGLGLAIVKWIAESHNGAVELDSRPESGSVFTVTLPK